MAERQIEYHDMIREVYKDKYRGLEISSITFQITEECTLRCKYCYQHSKSPKIMSLDTAKKFIDVIFSDERYKKTNLGFVLEFIGGEPLLYPKLISDIIDYYDYKCIMENSMWGVYSKISICSNGTEYKKPEVQNLIKKINNRLSFTVSIDGNKELHDSARIHLDGRGSYDEALYAATDYEKRFNVDLGSKMTIAPSNIIFTYVALKHYLESGKKWINANCVYEEGWTYDHAKILYEQLKKLADFKLKNHIDAHISIFDDSMFHKIDENNNTNWCGGTGKMLACDPDGILYPCLRYMPSSVGRNRDNYLTIGTVNDVIEWNKVDELSKITRRSQSTDECFYCPIGAGCGWCSAYNWESQGSANKRATYICCMHKARALANVYYWNKYYRQVGSEKRMKNYCPENWALEIISKEEFEMLNKLTEN